MKAAEELPKHLNYNELLGWYGMNLQYLSCCGLLAYIRARNTLPVTVYCLPDDCSGQSLDCVFVCSYWWITWWRPKQLNSPKPVLKVQCNLFCMLWWHCMYIYGDTVSSIWWQCTYICGDAVSSIWWHCTYVRIRWCCIFYMVTMYVCAWWYCDIHVVILWHPCGDDVTSMWWRCVVWQMVTSRSWWMRWTVARCCMLWSRWRTPTLSSSRMSG